MNEYTHTQNIYKQIISVVFLNKFSYNIFGVIEWDKSLSYICNIVV